MVEAASGITPARDELVAGFEAQHPRAEVGEHEYCDGCGHSWPCPTAQLLARLREAEGRSQLVEAGHATLMSMVETAASTLRDLADLDDEGSPRLMVIAAEAKRTLKAMREIGGVE